MVFLVLEHIGFDKHNHVHVYIYTFSNMLLNKYSQREFWLCFEFLV